MEQQCEDTFHAVSNAIVSEGIPPNFEQGPVVPPTSRQIVVPDIVSGIHFHAEEAMKKGVLETVTAQHNGTENPLSFALKSLMERIFRKSLSSGQTIAEITEVVIDHPGLIAPTTALVRSERQKCTDQRAEIEELYRRYLEAEMKLDRAGTSNLSEVAEKPPTDIFESVRTNRNAS